MKKLCFLSTLALFLLLNSSRILAQTNLDQSALMKQFIGKWQGNTGKDTLEVWEFEQYGKALKFESYLMVKGKRTANYLSTMVLDPEINKFKGLNVGYAGWLAPWIGEFISANKFSGQFVQNFNPELVTGKWEFAIENLNNFALNVLDKDGVKQWEIKFKKVK
jgi:hypothetical protein